MNKQIDPSLLVYDQKTNEFIYIYSTDFSNRDKYSLDTKGLDRQQLLRERVAVLGHYPMGFHVRSEDYTCLKAALHDRPILLASAENGRDHHGRIQFSFSPDELLDVLEGMRYVYATGTEEEADNASSLVSAIYETVQIEFGDYSVS